MRSVLSVAKLIPVVLAGVFLVLLGCRTDESPLKYIGMSAMDIRDQYGPDVRVVYVQRGVPDPRTFSGEILLSPFTIRHRVTHREYAAFVYCQVKEGSIEYCKTDEVDDPSDELLKWFPGKKLDEIPVEFYVQTPPPSVLPGWTPIKEYNTDLKNFSGVFYLNRGRYIHFLEFSDGECVGVKSEVGDR